MWGCDDAEKTSEFSDRAVGELNKTLESFPLIKIADGGIVSDSAEASAGYLPKWIQHRPDGKYLIKASSWEPTRDLRSLYESESEVIASRIADIIGIPHIPYELIESTELPGNITFCRSPWILAEDEEARSLFRVMRSDAELYKLLDKKPLALVIDKVSTRLELQSFGEYVKDMLVFDYLTNNPDRHFRNIELIYNKDRGYKLFPLYDNGNALFGTYSDAVISTINPDRVSIDHDQSKGFFDSHNKAINRLKLIGLPLNTMKKICNHQVAIIGCVSGINLPSNRRAIIENLLEQRISEMSKVLEG